jgi:hypothetical protein
MKPRFVDVCYRSVQCSLSRKGKNTNCFWNFYLNILMYSLRHKMAGLVLSLFIQGERERESVCDVEFLIIDSNVRNKSHMQMNLCFEARNVLLYYTSYWHIHYYNYYCLYYHHHYCCWIYVYRDMLQYVLCKWSKVEWLFKTPTRTVMNWSAWRVSVCMFVTSG